MFSTGATVENGDVGYVCILRIVSYNHRYYFNEYIKQWKILLNILM